VILEIGQQHTKEVISKLESNTKFAKIEQKNDVIGLLDMRAQSDVSLHCGGPEPILGHAGSAEKDHSNQSRQIRIRV
jgi:hypothetical protein